MNRRAILVVNLHFLYSLFQFPPNVTLCEMYIDNSRQSLMIVVESDEFPETEPGQVLPKLQPIKVVQKFSDGEWFRIEPGQIERDLY